MTTTAPIVLTMIVRDEALDLKACLDSVRPHVQQVVIVDTGSSDNTLEVAKPYADVLVQWTGCNNAQGQIENFSSARNYALQVAQTLKSPPPFAMWLDADDVLEGGHRLLDVVTATYGPTPYTHNPQAVVAFDYDVSPLLYPRERIFPLLPAKPFAWKGWVHETLMRTDAHVGAIVGALHTQRVVVRHAPSKSIKDADGKEIKPGKIREPGRNLRILRAQMRAEGGLDPRSLFYLGRECLDNGRVSEGLKWLQAYTQVSTWDEERCIALMRMAEAHMARIDHDQAELHALRALGARPDWAEPRLLLAKIYHHRAMRSHGGALDGNDFRRIATLIPEALNMPDTKTTVFLDRSLRKEAHLHLHLALYLQGNLIGALESVKAGLKIMPEHEGLIAAQVQYNTQLGHQRAAILSSISTEKMDENENKK